MSKKEESLFWADQASRKIIQEKGNKKKYVIASGITPSGVIHIGNFREVITTDIVGRALKKIGKEVRFIYSWDDYDVFRKVPANMPKKDILNKHLREPITLVPDVFECHKNYAEHNKNIFEKTLPLLDIEPEFISQVKMYENCKYAGGIKKALEETKVIKQILNQYRKQPLDEKWLPVSIFCEKCNKDTVNKIEYLGDYKLKYSCNCGFEDEFDFRKKGIVKLKWRIDWPMRWNYEKVDFEPAGKDHYAAGGTRITGREIAKLVYNYEAPTDLIYEWIKIKGGKQFHSSTGVATTLNEVLEIYEPAIIRYLFAGSRPNTEFAISFDLDVLKLYEDFDKCERIYYGKEKSDNKKELEQQKRIYVMSSIKLSKKMLFQPSLRHLTTIIQLYKDFNKVKEYYKLKNKLDIERLKLRYNCAKNWLEKYAPEDFKFELQEEIPKEIQLTEKQREALHEIASVLDKKWDENTLYEEFYNIYKRIGITPKELFEAGYKVLLNKTKGPKLAGFILIIGKEKVKKMFKGV